MSELSMQFAIWIALCFLVAGFVKGVTGLGLPTVAMALLTLFLAPVAAMALLVLPSLVTNLWQLFSGPYLKPVLLRIWPMLLGIVLGTAAGAALSLQALAFAPALLGLALVGYALWGLVQAPRRLPARMEGLLAPLIGLATGLFTVATGVFVVPAVPYLQVLGLEKDELVQALGLSFTVSTLAMGVGLLGTGSFALAQLGVSLFALVPAVAGMFLGQLMRRYIAANAFRRLFFISLFALGLHLIVKSLFAA